MPISPTSWTDKNLDLSDMDNMPFSWDLAEAFRLAHNERCEAIRSMNIEFLNEDANHPIIPAFDEQAALIYQFAYEIYWSLRYTLDDVYDRNEQLYGWIDPDATIAGETDFPWLTTAKVEAALGHAILPPEAQAPLSSLFWKQIYTWLNLCTHLVARVRFAGTPDSRFGSEGNELIADAKSLSIADYNAATESPASGNRSTRQYRSLLVRDPADPAGIHYDANIDTQNRTIEVEEWENTSGFDRQWTTYIIPRKINDLWVTHGSTRNLISNEYEAPWGVSSENSIVQLETLLNNSDDTGNYTHDIFTAPFPIPGAWPATVPTASVNDYSIKGFQVHDHAYILPRGGGSIDKDIPAGPYVLTDYSVSDGFLFLS